MQSLTNNTQKLSNKCSHLLNDRWKSCHNRKCKHKCCKRSFELQITGVINKPLIMWILNQVHLRYKNGYTAGNVLRSISDFLGNYSSNARDGKLYCTEIIPRNIFPNITNCFIRSEFIKINNKILTENRQIDLTTITIPKSEKLKKLISKHRIKPLLILKKGKFKGQLVVSCETVFPNNTNSSNGYQLAIIDIHNNNRISYIKDDFILSKIICITELSENRLITNGPKNSIIVWDYDNNKTKQYFPKDRSYYKINNIILLDNGKIATSNSSSYIILWDSNTFKEIGLFDLKMTTTYSYLNYRYIIREIIPLKNNKIIISYGCIYNSSQQKILDSSRIELWDCNNKESQFIKELHSYHLCCKVSGNIKMVKLDNNLVVVAKGCVLKIWDTESQDTEPIKSFNAYKEEYDVEIEGITTLPGNRFITHGNKQNIFKYWRWI